MQNLKQIIILVSIYVAEGPDHQGPSLTATSIATPIATTLNRPPLSKGINSLPKKLANKCIYFLLNAQKVLLASIKPINQEKAEVTLLGVTDWLRRFY